MKARVLRLIAHENHFQTLCSLGLPVSGYALIDDEHQIIWSDSTAGAHKEHLFEARSLVAHERKEDRNFQFAWAELPIDGHVFSMHINDDVDGYIGQMILVIGPTIDLRGSGYDRVHLAMMAAASNIMQEFILNKELEAMATELAERYEELNLVFQSDAPGHKQAYGFESLRRLVKDTTAYLGVGLAALMLPTKNFEIYDLDEQITVPDAPGLLRRLRQAYFTHIQETGDPLVVNHGSDLRRAGLADNLEYKVMMVPVHFGSDEIQGMLVAANVASHADFTNSDRNLLDVMANKVIKVLQANFDRLTGLENASSFEWAVRQSLARSSSRGLTHAILHVDIDRTNVINDISGREAGDALIQRVAQILNDAVRSQDNVARIGGDEFGVLLESCSLDSAARLASKICRQIEAENFNWNGTLHPLSACIGVAPITADSESVASVLGSAEVARQAAQERGRNRIQVYELDDVELLRRRGEFRWVGRIQAALREGRFELHAQLIQPLKDTNQPLHYEILVRMRGEKGELITPNRFIPAAEHYHLMPDIDCWVIGTVVDTVLDLADDPRIPPVHFSVNLSGLSLTDDEVHAAVTAQLERLGSLADRVCFEITESAAITNLDAALAFIKLAKGFGVRFSLDDFGSGLSSFAYLKRFDVDYIKLDGSFVKHVHTDPVSEAMVTSINHVAQVMELATIAEFVENGAIVKKLEQIGVDYAQGYHFAKPVLLSDALRAVRRPRDAASG